MSRYTKANGESPGATKGRGPGTNCRAKNQPYGCARGGNGRMQRFRLQTPQLDPDFFRRFCLGIDSPENPIDKARDADVRAAIDELQRKIDALRKLSER